jgi:hypothetical protein
MQWDWPPTHQGLNVYLRDLGHQGLQRALIHQEGGQYAHSPKELGNAGVAPGAVLFTGLQPL